MIEEIRIRSLGVIESSDLPLAPGLTVITGETGAGKTMVVTALGLLLGGRADSGAVRTGARAARVEGLARVERLPRTAAAVEEAGGEIEDDAVVLARNISAEGRSRAYVGGASVPAAVLAEVSGPLVAVHGQSDQHRLLRSSAQREALDRFGGEAVAAALTAYREVHRELLAVEAEVVEVVERARERAQEADRLRFGLEEIEAVAPSADESERLLAEETRLANSDELRGAAETAREALSSDHAADDALARVAGARSALEFVAEHDPALAELASRAAEVGYLLTDLATDVAAYSSSIETDPVRLSAVSERRAALAGLTRKYGESIGEVLDWARRAAQRLTELDDDDERVARLHERRHELRRSLAERAGELSALRRTAAHELAARAVDELRHLAMPHARFEVRVAPAAAEHAGGAAPASVEGVPPGAPVLLVDGAWARFGRSGVDEVEMVLAANPGSEPRPLSKGASGGELSRVMLALEVALAATSPVPTFVFDEVDAGVGGKAGIEIGRRLAALGEHKQVLVVTHLPQVAAFADRHVVVRKSSDGSVTSSGLQVLDEADREQELSRMLAGLEASDTALAHARELLAEAGHPSR